MDIIMSTGKLRVTEIVGKTRARLFGNLKVGDVIEITSKVASVGSSRGRSYSVSLRVEHLRTGNVKYFTYNEIGNYITNFNFEKVEEI